MTTSRSISRLSFKYFPGRSQSPENGDTPPALFSWRLNFFQERLGRPCNDSDIYSIVPCTTDSLRPHVNKSHFLLASDFKANSYYHNLTLCSVHLLWCILYLSFTWLSVY